MRGKYWHWLQNEFILPNFTFELELTFYAWFIVKLNKFIWYYRVNILNFVCYFFFTRVFIDTGCPDIASLWKATKIKNHDENAWSGWWAILDDFVWLFSCHISYLHTVFCDIWLGRRWESNQWTVFSFLTFSSFINVSCFLSGLKFFTMNDYSIQFVFYFLYINLQISLAFLLASLFSNVKTATGLIIATLSCS